MIDQDVISEWYLESACEFIEFIERFCKGTILFATIIVLI